jgi:hypothetical protein
MEIEAASLAQVRRAQNGRLVLVDDDVANVVRDLQEIDAGLRVRFSEQEDVFVVYHVVGGRESLVASVRELDQRLVSHLRELDWRQRQPGYRFADEIDEAERVADRREREELSERMGPANEKLAWALDRDLNGQRRIFVPGGEG